MEDRVVAFVKALRAAGVRVSLAESIDGFRAMEELGITDRALFHDALLATLIKDAASVPTFEELFPLFFGTADRPMSPGGAGLDQLTPEEMQRLRQEISQLREKLRELMQRLMDGRNLTPEELQALANRSGIQSMESLRQRRWVERRMEQQIGLSEMKQALEELLQQLENGGLSEEALEQIRQQMLGNGQIMRDQIEQFVGSGIAERMSEEYNPQQGPDLEHRPFGSLSEAESDVLRQEVRRLAALLRSRAALRQRRDKTGQVDVKRTMRNNLRFGGVPMKLEHRKRQQKPKLVIICDISTSMRPVAEFMLRMIYELQDQVSKTRSFAFISNIHDISEPLASGRADDTVQNVLSSIPPGYYNTDLGSSLDRFLHEHLDSVDWRTTVIIVGDGRNNFNDPRLSALTTVRRHAKRLIWFIPEDEWQWGTGDSDMLLYAPLCDRVHIVSNLAQLTSAVDRLLSN
ncbi:MAG TPA: VWA domain-containing protein [Herpetosiphonaceae bacterium]